MPVVVMPTETAIRLKDRLLDLGERHTVRMFPAKEVVAELQFTQSEIDRFGGDTGTAIVVAVKDIEDLRGTIPASENGVLNYIEVKNLKALMRLDPFGNQK